MPIVPWKIAAQSYTVLHPETKEPFATLQFVVNHDQADVMGLRVVPGDDSTTPAIELQFSTGGYVLEPVVMQPRWLKAFERVDPNLHLEDDVAWDVSLEGLGDDQKAKLTFKRDGYLKRREAYEAADKQPVPEGGEGSSVKQDGEERLDMDQRAEDDAAYDSSHKLSTDYNASPGINQHQDGEDPSPNTPAAQDAQAARAGVDASTPEKGMVSQGAVPSSSGQAKVPGQGPVVDRSSMTRQTAKR